jgi:hypothetical protein
MARRLFILAAVGVLAFGVGAPAYAADIVTPAGACVASATWQTGGVSKTTAALTGDDVIEIPRADTVSWQGGVAGLAAGGAREVAGRVALALPPPFGSITLARWQGDATEVQRSGTYSYDLPAVVPAGVLLDLHASHDEQGRRHCTAQVAVIIAGGAFDSPLIWAALAGLVLLAAAVTLLGRSASPGAGRMVIGALLGLPLGLFLGLVLVLFGVIPLASPLLTALIPLGAAAAAAWIRWSPLRKPAAVP